MWGSCGRTTSAFFKTFKTFKLDRYFNLSLMIKQCPTALPWLQFRALPARLKIQRLRLELTRVGVSSVVFQCRSLCGRSRSWSEEEEASSGYQEGVIYVTPYLGGSNLSTIHAVLLSRLIQGRNLKCTDRRPDVYNACCLMPRWMGTSGNIGQK